MFDIITDSTAYFTRERARELNITVIPMTFTIGDRRYAEGYSGEQKNHIADIEKNAELCKTSQPNIKVITDAYKRSVKLGKRALFITISSRLSGTYNSALLAAAEFGSGKIAVFDSLSVAAGLKMQVERAAALKAGGNSLEQTIKILEQERAGIEVLFSASDMEALRRSGRVGLVKQSISNILNLVPLLKLSGGKIESITGARGIYNFLKKVKEQLPQNLEGAVLMAFDPSVLKIMEEYLQRNYKAVSCIEFLKPGAVLAVHLGAKSFGIAWRE